MTNILLTGATGYVGGRLLSRLEQQAQSGSLRLRCMARSPARLARRVDSATEVVQGDVLEPKSLLPALDGIEVAFYLIHSMGDSGDFVAKELEAATNFAKAAAAQGLKRIIYLGGLGSEDLSEHLSSRQQVGDALRDSGAITIELRSAAVIGSGSASFEMVRALVNHLPIMITPNWVHTRTQPIAIEDALDYLQAAIDVDLGESRIVEIGASEAVSYAELMQEYARQQGLKRFLIPVPVLTPRLSSLWLGLVTPLYARIGRKLIDGLRNETIVRDQSAAELFPQIKPRSVREAIARSLLNEDLEFAETRWSDAYSSNGPSLETAPTSYGGDRQGSRLIDHRCIKLDLSPQAAFAPVQRIGGKRGWYFANFLWWLRGFFDLLVGGVGIRRGRKNPVVLHVGDALDWWRIEQIEPGRLLRLVAEMKVPGRAWLQFEVKQNGEAAELHQTAIFDPKGLLGFLYWYGIYPIHALMFRGMIRSIGREAVRLSESPPQDSPASA